MLGLDSYTIPARVFPAVLVALPAGLAVAACFPQDLVTWGVGSGVLSTGATALAAERVRRHGKAVQERLFAQLGAKPTTILLRHRDSTLDPRTKRRYHACLQNAVPGAHLPTADEEAADPVTADAEYDSCVTFLLEVTRNRKQFPLVFKELVNYGMVRNLRGMKPAAVTIAMVGAFVCTGRAVVNGPGDIHAGGAVGAIISAALLATWFLRLNDEWVKAAAFDYARALLASCDRLRSSTFQTAKDSG